MELELAAGLPNYAARMNSLKTTTYACTQVMIMLFLSTCFAGELVNAGISHSQKEQIFIFSAASNSEGSTTISHHHPARPQYRSTSTHDQYKHGEHGLRVNLMHPDYISSPLSDVYMNNSTSRLERIRRAVGHSKDRVKHIVANILAYSRSTTIKSASANSTIKSSLADFTSPVASDSGAYVMQLKLGTPPQTLIGIVDTGSDLVWVQCNPCRRCYKQRGPVFSPLSSSSYKNLSCNSPNCTQFSQRICDSNCQYVYQYGDGSGTMGDFSTETITMTTTSGGQQQIPNFAFGCGHTNLGSFGGAAGIVGLGQGAVSLTSQLGKQIQNKFSYCLVSFDDAPFKTSPLFFGSAATIEGPRVQSTPILTKGSTYYYVGLNGVNVGGKELNISLDGGTIIDSGTTLTLLEDSAYSLVRAAFKSAIGLPLANGTSAALDLCFDVTGKSTFKVPTLTLHLVNTDFIPPSQNYFMLIDNKTLCLTMDSSRGLGISIIGNLMQQNYHLEYDQGRATIYFSPATCDSL